MYTHEKKSWSTEGTSNLEDWGYASPENLQFYVITDGISVAELQTFLLVERP